MAKPRSKQQAEIPQGAAGGRERRVRLFVDEPLASGAALTLTRAQAHYVSTVMRLRPGDRLAVFNGRDGEWRASVAEASRGRCRLEVLTRNLPQSAGVDLWLLFAPLKAGPTDVLVTKATELGVAALWPVRTEFTQSARVNSARVRANAVEAAEQCGRLELPAVFAPAPLAEVLAGWQPERCLLVCDEAGAPAIATVLARARAEKVEARSWAVLVGPEGGFSTADRETMRTVPELLRVGLGPRILRAETAALAALTCWQALIGDWQAEPRGPAQP
jgi:16S rRNA (uracil1498-N3)-methyltransferase